MQLLYAAQNFHEMENHLELSAKIANCFGLQATPLPLFGVWFAAPSVTMHLFLP